MVAMEQAGRGPKRVRWPAWIAVVIALTIAIAVLDKLQAPSPEQRALARMPPDDRRAVYARAMENLNVLCGRGPRSDALERQCAEQIQFVLQFPECDEACLSIARMHQPRPKK